MFIILRFLHPPHTNIPVIHINLSYKIFLYGDSEDDVYCKTFSACSLRDELLK